MLGFPEAVLMLSPFTTVTDALGQLAAGSAGLCADVEPGAVSSVANEGALLVGRFCGKRISRAALLSVGSLLDATQAHLLQPCPHRTHSEGWDTDVRGARCAETRAETRSSFATSAKVRSAQKLGCSSSRRARVVAVFDLCR